MARPWLLLALLAGVAAQAPGADRNEAQLDDMFSRFKQAYNRSYVRHEEARRFAAFKMNVRRADELNAAQSSTDCADLFDSNADCVFGITKFADLFKEEFAATRLGYRRTPAGLEVKQQAPILTKEELASGAGPDSVDWRTQGAVTAVKDQGDCGSCWAFSTTEEVESAVFMATGKLETLSTQQIISCDKGEDEGCNGGDTVTAYKYLEAAGGLDTASDYPDRSHTTGRTGKCTWDKKKAAKISGFTYATKPCNSGSCKHQDEDALAAALAAKGPVSICVNAGDWQMYKRGVFSSKCSAAAQELDHCVQLVGYDKTSSPPSWLIRNSWNTDWGEKGYLRLKMGGNLCGVADEATIAQATTVTAQEAIAI